MFKGKHLTITTKIEDTNEMYYEQIKMESAVNYGYVTQGKQYLIVDSNHVLSSMYRNDHIAVMSSDNINTPEKLHEVFQHLDIVVTSDLDLKEMHDKMVLSGDKKVAYFKTVILLNHNSFVHLQEVIEVGVKVKRASSADMTDHEQLCNEIETFLNISKEDSKEIFKDKETAPLTDKITAFSSWVRKRNGDDKEDKKEDKKKEDEKKDVVKDYNPLAYVTSFGLLNNEQLRNNMGELSSYASNNYSSDPPITTKKGELYDKVYQIKPDDVIGEYTNTLSSLYKQLCRKTLSSFFANLSLEKLLDIVLISEENFDLFTKYIQIRGNDAVKDKRVSGSKVEYDNFLNLMQKIISVCVKEEKFIKLIDIIIKKVLIQGSYTIINESLKNKNKKINDAFNNDSAALKGLNLNLVPDLIKNLMKDASHKIYENEDDFMNLLTILIMIPLTYREEKLFSKNIYMAVYKLLMPIASQSDKYSLSLKSKVLNFKLLKEVFDKVNFNLGINDYS